jgi:outer membrane protein assembly factor BamD (BamD/ComL family)
MKKNLHTIWIAVVLLGLLLAGCGSPQPRPVSAGARDTDVNRPGLEQLRARLDTDPTSVIEEADYLYRAAGDTETRINALILKADAQGAAGLYDEATATYNVFLRNFPNDPRVNEVVRKVLDLGWSVARNGVPVDVLWIPLGESIDPGIRIMRSMLERYPFLPFSADYHFIVANLHYADKDFISARAWYSRISKDYPECQWVEAAQFQIAECHFQEWTGIDYDPKPLILAKEQFLRYTEKFPGGDRIDEATARIKTIETLLAEKEYTVAQFYSWRGQEEAARFMLRQLTRRYPDTEWAARAREELGD